MGSQTEQPQLNPLNEKPRLSLEEQEVQNDSIQKSFMKR